MALKDEGILSPIWFPFGYLSEKPLTNASPSVLNAPMTLNRALELADKAVVAAAAMLYCGFSVKDVQGQGAGQWNGVIIRPS